MAITVRDVRSVLIDHLQELRTEWSRDRWRHVTSNGQGRDPVNFEA